jgi:hypothetical protein
MKIFQGGGWGDKINFVDKHNVLVGYDMAQCCCEHADWYILDKIESDTTLSGFSGDLEDYNFDPFFFQKVDGDYDCGGMIVFKLINEKNGDEKYLHLFNIHNGYYGHGFEVSIDNKIVRQGGL